MNFRRRIKKICCCCCCSKKSKDGKRDVEVYVKGAKDDDSSVVMGNSNATIHPSAKNLDPNVSEIYSQCEVSGAVVIERSKKSKTKSNLNGIVSNVSSNELAKVKDLEKQLDNLNNQLKERTNRIDELELVLKNNNNNIEEEKNEFNKLQCDLKNELAQKNEFIQLQENQLKVAEELVEKSNKGLEALAMVIKYYVTQLEQTSSALKSSRSENSNISNKVKKLDIKQLELQSTITKLTENLESESCRCEALQKEFEALKLNHQAEISRLNEEHIIERNKAVTQKQKEYDEKFQEVLDKQTEDAENHRNEINRLKDEHEKAIQELKNEKEKEARISVESPRVTSPGGTPIYADKYNNMPEELKSLNIVLDMKNEELKNLRSKTMDLERKIEKHQELQTKYDALLQKNQSMQEMLKMKSHNEQQLSVEREDLLEKFDKESKKVSQLSMEKEQLIWRASNPDLSYRSLSRCDEDDECDEDEERDSPPSPLRSGSFSANSTPRRPKVNGEAEIAKKLKRRSMNF